MSVTDLAVEVPRLTGIITEGEIAELAGLTATLPLSARDTKQR